QQTIWPLADFADALSQLVQHRFAAQFFRFRIEDDAFQVASAGDAAGAHAADEDVALPRRKAITGVNGHAGHGDLRKPRDERRLHPLTCRMLGDARTRVVATETHDWPSVIASGQDDVDFVAAIGTVFVVPQLSRLWVNEQRQRVAMSECVDLGSIAGAAD